MATPYSFSRLIHRRRENARRAAQESAHRQRLLEGLPALFAKYRVLRAYIFGSSAKDYCRKNSDIDLYVEGIPPEKYWDLWKDIESYTDKRIDLYCERDDQLFIKKIKERGRLIYEA